MNTWSYQHLFSDQRDIHFPGPLISKVQSGQSGLLFTSLRMNAEVIDSLYHIKVLLRFCVE